MVAQSDVETLSPLSQVKQAVRDRLANVRRPGPISLALIGLACVVLVGAGVLSILAGRADPAATLEKAWENLEAGQYSRSRDIATRFISQNSRLSPQISEAAFVVGRSLCGEADDEWNQERKQGLFLVASRYLQESYNRGMPTDREEEGVYFLARSTFESGRATASLPFWRELLDIGSEERSKEIHHYLARVHLLDPELDETRGLGYIQNYLDFDDLTDDERSEALIEKAELLLRLKRWDEGLAAINAVPSDAVRPSRQRLLKGRFLLEQTVARDTEPDNNADEIMDDYRTALAVLTSVLTDLDDDTGQDDEAMYFMATCYGRMGQLDDAERLFSELRRDKLTEPLGWAAGIEEAHIQYLAGDMDAAADSLFAVLEQTSKHDELHNNWMSVKTMSGRLAPIMAQLVNDRRFEDAERLAKFMWPPLPRTDALLWQAKLHQQWGTITLAEAQQRSDEGMSEAMKAKADGLKHMRDAGLAYYKLARLNRESTSYVEYLWLAADSYLDGHDFTEAIRIYELLTEEDLPERMARLYYKLGEARLSAGQPTAALASLERCVVEHPSDPDTYSARLLASRIHLDRNNVEQAKQLLIDNLEQEALTPKSVEWRESLFALGQALYLEAAALEVQSRAEGVDSDVPQQVERGLQILEASHLAFQDAILRLNEAVQRYILEVPTFEHRYLLGEAYRQSAKWPAKKALTVSVTTTRYRLQEQARQLYAQAHEVYVELLADLSREQDRRPLDDMERRLLRNTYFARADMLFELKDYPAAIDAYSSAANQYNQQPESLEAFVRIATCYRRMNRFSDARGVLEQAKLFLQDRIPPDADYANTTRYNRDEWATYLDLLISL